jgi:eukaryotic-like serine/threonine-protein kinase
MHGWPRHVRALRAAVRQRGPPRHVSGVRARIVHLEQGLVLDERYELRQRLGSGSMAEVWAAREVASGQPVAIKVVAELLAPSTQARLRFEREVQAIGSIQHPNVVALLGHGHLEDRRPYLAMEHFEGRGLDDYLEEYPQLGAHSVLQLAGQVLDGLRAAHDRGIIHRDLKPANIFLAQIPSGRRQVKILDFGVAFVLDLASDPEDRLTRAGALLGSPRYMPVELARGSTEIDARSDIFGVAAVMYRALTGGPPFGGESLGQIMTRIMDHDIAPLCEARPDLPDELVACVERALSHDVADRYASAAEMKQALQEILPRVHPS